MQYPFLWISIGLAIFLTATNSGSYPYDRSTVDFIVALSLSAALLYTVQRCLPSFLDGARDTQEQYDLKLDDLGVIASSQEQKHRRPSTSDVFRYRRPVFKVFLLVFGLVIRLELHRRLANDAQCAGRSLNTFIPLVLAINECRYYPQQRRASITSIDKHSLDGLLKRTRVALQYSRWRYIPSALVVACGCYLVSNSWNVMGSTYICPIVSGENVFSPRLQKLTFLLDCVLAILAQEIAGPNATPRRRKDSSGMTFATIIMGTVLCYVGYTLLLYVFDRDQLHWLLIHDSPALVKSMWIALGYGLLTGTFLLFSIYCLLRYGVCLYSIMLTSCITMYSGVYQIWSERQPFPPQASSGMISGFVLIYLGTCLADVAMLPFTRAQTTRTLLVQVLFSIIFFILLRPGLESRGRVSFHPIELLMFNANTQHENYIKYASHSADLTSAVETYRQRYHDEPPPGFDVWYEYAQNRSVLIIDDYDQIYQDLLPFRMVTAADLRKQTWEAVSNPWNEISGISIRSGKADVQENVLPTHRWMLEGVAVMINTFAQHLPDMDLAFNLNDESRVAMPYSKIEEFRTSAAQANFSGKATWSADRAQTWLPVAKEDYAKTVFENFSFQKNFRRFGTIGCHPKSLSITQPRLSSQSQLCTECALPHSTGQFVSDWTLAADMCHQPDMSDLHGFYLSPAAFKTTHDLMPIFSQSKASGYNDILYPSSWNYMDKAVYQPVKPSGEYGTDTYSSGYPDPTFKDKDNILYWRGATSEGVSPGSHVWRGMTRQRLVHLANNATSNSDHDRVVILLPDPDHPQEYVYTSLPGSALIPLGLQRATDIKLADHIARCGGVDCPDQEKEFGLVTPVNFQAHWKYRFLFDMDGAAFSGRFLPFIQSRSLPFKTALFREWYNSRITAWRHFVPIDMRLHDVWSTLAYFAGVDGIWPKTNKKYVWEAHTKQAESIAEEGRIWAKKVLRKEDMEVYFFRLLLEWGRLTDDKRNELGFSLG